ncbi:hypothetical protein U1Q18_019611 [Sarracenia purpurea var. burkii]
MAQSYCCFSSFAIENRRTKSLLAPAFDIIYLISERLYLGTLMIYKDHFPLFAILVSINCNMHILEPEFPSLSFPLILNTCFVGSGCAFYSSRGYGMEVATVSAIILHSLLFLAILAADAAVRYRFIFVLLPILGAVDLDCHIDCGLLFPSGIFLGWVPWPCCAKESLDLAHFVVMVLLIVEII